MSDATIVGHECKFATHIPSNDRAGIGDYHLIKETVHYSDGSVKPKLRLLHDYLRPFYITSKSKRSYQQKKEWERLDNLDQFMVSESDLRSAIAKRLEISWSKDSLRKLKASPYIYGCDISSTALLKHQYQTKYPELQSKYTVATFDIETDVLRGATEIIVATIVMENRSFTAVLSSFVKGLSSIEDRFQTAVTRYIGEYTSKRKMTTELYIASDCVDLIKAVFAKAHEWKPDFMAVWNVNYDIPYV